eukprot:331733-Chlamydomonas_euryale.AAC.3
MVPTLGGGLQGRCSIGCHASVGGSAAWRRRRLGAYTQRAQHVSVGACIAASRRWGRERGWGAGGSAAVVLEVDGPPAGIAAQGVHAPLRRQSVPNRAGRRSLSSLLCVRAQVRSASADAASSRACALGSGVAPCMIQPPS